MRTGTKVLALSAGLALFATGQAIAQSGAATPSQSTTGGNSGVSVGPSGVTSGPAATGQPATLGTGGVSSAVPGQTGVLRQKGGVAVRGEKRGQHGGTSASVKAGKSGAEAGKHKGQQ